MYVVTVTDKRNGFNESICYEDIGKGTSPIAFRTKRSAMRYAKEMSESFHGSTYDVKKVAVVK